MKGARNQQWAISYGDNPSFQLRGTNFCVNAGEGPANFVRAKIWECYPGLAQQTWYYTDDNRIAITGGTQCLDSGGSSGLTETYTCTDGNTNRIWTLGNPKSVGGDVHQIHYKYTSKCITVSDSSYGDGTLVQLDTCVSHSDFVLQSWDIDRGSGAIQLAGTNYASSDPQNGVLAKIWQCCPGLYQQTWYYTDDRIAITGGDHCLDFQAESLNVVQVWRCNDNDGWQIWTLEGRSTAKPTTAPCTTTTTTTALDPSATNCDQITTSTGNSYYTSGNKTFFISCGSIANTGAVDSPLNEITQPSFRACVDFCTQTVDCTIVRFEDDAELCLLYTGSPSGLDIQAVGHDEAVLQQQQCL